jgi:hypothetical protein
MSTPKICHATFLGFEAGFGTKIAGQPEKSQRHNENVSIEHIYSTTSQKLICFGG